MVSFDMSFRPMPIKEIVEEEGALLTEGIISWLSIDRGYSQGNKVQVVNGSFCTCIGVLSGSAYRRGRYLERLVAFSVF